MTHGNKTDGSRLPTDKGGMLDASWLYANRSEENSMGTPATTFAPPAVPASADDLDGAALVRWWAQLEAQRPGSAVVRRRHPASVPTGASVLPDSAPLRGENTRNRGKE
jgi:hypothetical protein